MNPEELARQIDHAAQQSDRWLFLAAIAFICACGIVIIRYLVKQNEKQSATHGALTEKVLTAWSDSTSAIKEVRDWLKQHGANHLLMVFLALALGGCATLAIRPAITYHGNFGDYSLGYDGKAIITKAELGRGPQIGADPRRFEDGGRK